MSYDFQTPLFRYVVPILLGLFLFGQVESTHAQEKKKSSKPRYTDPAEVDEDYAYQGEYSGEIAVGGKKLKMGVQVIAEGKGRFKAVMYKNGLPGDGWDRKEKTLFKGGKLNEGKLLIKDERIGFAIQDGQLTVVDKKHGNIGTLQRVERQSKTLGAKPPEGAVVLFDGTNVEQWNNGKIEDGLLVQGTTSLPTFGSHKIHIEFRLPYMPRDRGQARGNSGIYVQGKYEVQMLDSFGLEGKKNECGGIYSVKDCDFNMCYPPLTWQTYDIEYKAAKYDEDGKLVANPRMTVYHNGEMIHANVELPGKRNTTAAPVKAGPENGPLYLQDHGCPIRYRNIWVVEKPSKK